MGRCRSLGSLKLLLSYASQLPGASFLCVFFSQLEFLSAHHREWLQPAGCRIGQVLFSFPIVDCAQGSEIYILRAGITDDCDILVY